MQRITDLLTRGVRIVAAFALPFMVFISSGGLVHAATANSIYSYNLTGSGSTFSNGAASNSGATLALAGNGWSHATPSSEGVYFTGNLTDTQSGAGYQPTTGNTMNVPATSSIGVTASFKFQAPPGGVPCFNDSPNIAQIGRSADHEGQIKIQFSKCGIDANHVYVQCRMAGANTVTTVGPVINRDMPMTDGGHYIVKCYKTPDASGNATVTLRVVKVDTIYGNTVTSDPSTIAATGAMTTTRYVSIANKFPFTAQANNSDQFLGDISKVGFCQATTTTAVQTCLDTEVPEPALIPPVINTTLTGPSTLYAGQQGSYNLTVATSNDTSGSTGVVTTLTVPSNMSIVYAAGATTVSGNTATWNLGDIGPSTSLGKGVGLLLNSGTVGGTATVSAATTTTSGSCSNSGSTCSASTGATVVTSPLPVINTSFDSGPSSLVVGQQGEYHVTVATGSTSAGSTGVVTTMTVPSNMSIVYAVGATISGNTATWNFGDIGPSTSYGKAVQLVLNSGTVGDSLPVTLATTTTDSSCSNTGSTCSATSTATVSATSTAVLNNSLTGPSSLQIGQQGTYVTTLSNPTSGSTATGVTPSITLPSNMSVVNAYGGTVSGNTVTWSTISAINGGDAPARQVLVQLNSGTVGDTPTIAAAATTVDGTCSTYSSTCSASVNTTIATSPAINTSVTGPSTLYVGQSGTYTATVQNTASGTTAAGVTESVTVPTNMTIVTATGATISGHTATWTVGSLAGGSSVNEQVVATLDSGTVGDTATVSAATTTTDSACGNTASICSASVNTTVASAPTGVVLGTSVTGPSTLWVGQQGTYTATVQNTSSTDASGVSATVTVPSNMSIVSATGATISGNTATWTVGTLAGSTNVSEQVVAQLNSGTVGDTATVSAAVTTTDGSCSVSGSVCSASVNTAVNKQWVTNMSVETNNTGWTGGYGTATGTTVRYVSGYGGHTGVADLLVTASSSGTFGFSDPASARWVSNATVAGKTYTASVYVKPSFAGQVIVLRNRELNSSNGIVTDTQTSITATSADWQALPITNTITASHTGYTLTFAVYGSGMVSGNSFEADDMSFTSN